MASGPRKAVVLKADLPPVIRLSDGDYGYLTRYRIISEDRNRFSSWSPVYPVKISEPSPVNAGVVINGNIVQVTWETNAESKSWDIFSGFGFEITHKELTDNVATITTKNPHNISIGATVNISLLDEPFNGNFVVSSVGSATTFSYSLVSPNVAYHTDHGMARAFYHMGVTESNQYNFLTNTQAEDFIVIIQIASINRELSEFLTIFESEAIAL